MIATNKLHNSIKCIHETFAYNGGSLLVYLHLCLILGDSA